MLRNVLAVTAVALIVGACSSKDSLGSGDDGLKKQWNPCFEKACGAECTVCAPGDANCSETAVVKFCNADGTCGPGYPDCGTVPSCKADADCPAIGAPCQQCADGSFACPSSKCEAGQCVSVFETCQDECKTDADCPQVGAPCQKCPDGSIACPSVQCVAGQCAGSFPACKGYDPCAGKQCGDTCSLCPPNDPSCAETAVVKYCDAGGQCTLNYPVCGPQQQCKADSDCPAIELCKPCANGGCANVACVNGACGWECPPPTNPECKAKSDCPPIEPALCKLCSDGSCAQTDCVNGACQLVCK
jgi:hypothetical protein